MSIQNCTVCGKKITGNKYQEMGICKKCVDAVSNDNGRDVDFHETYAHVQRANITKAVTQVEKVVPFKWQEGAANTMYTETNNILSFQQDAYGVAIYNYDSKGIVYAFHIYSFEKATGYLVLTTSGYGKDAKRKLGAKQEQVGQALEQDIAANIDAWMLTNGYIKIAPLTYKFDGKTEQERMQDTLTAIAAKTFATDLWQETKEAAPVDAAPTHQEQGAGSRETTYTILINDQQVYTDNDGERSAMNYDQLLNQTSGAIVLKCNEDVIRSRASLHQEQEEQEVESTDSRVTRALEAYNAAYVLLTTAHLSTGMHENVTEQKSAIRSELLSYGYEVEYDDNKHTWIAIALEQEQEEQEETMSREQVEIQQFINNDTLPVMVALYNSTCVMCNDAIYTGMYIRYNKALKKAKHAICPSHRADYDYAIHVWSNHGTFYAPIVLDGKGDTQVKRDIHYSGMKRVNGVRQVAYATYEQDSFTTIKLYEHQGVWYQTYPVQAPTDDTQEQEQETQEQEGVITHKENDLLIVNVLYEHSVSPVKQAVLYKGTREIQGISFHYGVIHTSLDKLVTVYKRGYYWYDTILVDGALDDTVYVPNHFYTVCSGCTHFRWCIGCIPDESAIDTTVSIFDSLSIGDVVHVTIQGVIQRKAIVQAIHEHCIFVTVNDIPQTIYDYEIKNGTIHMYQM